MLKYRRRGVKRHDVPVSVKKCVFKIAFSVVTVGVDKLIKLWDGDEFSGGGELSTIVGAFPFTSCDFALDESDKFLTSSGIVEYWDTARSDPIRKWSWGHDTYNRVKFNPIETDLACATVRLGLQR